MNKKQLVMRVLLGFIAVLIGAILVDKSQSQFLLHDVMKHNPDFAPSFIYGVVRYVCTIISAATIVFIYHHAGHLILIKNSLIKGALVALLITLVNIPLMPAQVVDIFYYGDLEWSITSILENALVNVLVGIVVVFLVPTRLHGNKS